ncbi:MAG TPA: redox-sensing transcriptional repressor Rex [Acidimicrobiia bacterium]|nr:redox-sensing transcriptional repressor Rex [Acidimicrobiia bacterium]
MRLDSGAGSRDSKHAAQVYRELVNEIPKATVVRLPRYLRLLEDLALSKDVVSSEELAAAAGANAANVRRDLSHLDFHGVRGIGYSVAELKARIRQELGIAERQRVAILGAGNLGRALANYGGLSRRGFDVVALYDTDVRKIGSKVGSITIQDLDLLDGDCTSKSFEIAILAVPAVAAQQVADRLVEHGIRSILNFAPVRVNVPEKVSVRQVDLSMELQVLSYYGSRL